MTAHSQDPRQWITELERAAGRLLAGQRAARNPDGCDVRAERCPEHGDSCARVRYGVLVDHFAWADEDPKVLAGRLVGTMLPRRP